MSERNNEKNLSSDEKNDQESDEEDTYSDSDSSSDGEPNAKCARVTALPNPFSPHERFKHSVENLEKSEFENILKNDDDLCWRGEGDTHDGDVTARKARVHTSPIALTVAAAEAAETALAMCKKDKKMDRKRKLSLLKTNLAASASAITTNLQTDGKISSDRVERARKYQTQLENGTGCVRSVLCNHCGCRLLNPDPSKYTGGFDPHYNSKKPSKYFYCCPGCGCFGKTTIKI
jgi:hypothetical protein